MGRGWRPHTRASSIDPLLAVPREKTHDCCWYCHHRKGGRAGHPMVREGCAKGERREE
ncbi:unnamed protein product [Spirodela intermedia]|uniref:Uncharacterized protein n=1 Tax=Spirodela intermedia TaxID=51605 RepID=A0A7I8II28_SPIIN|nr:unnamed protein product [Spirodela intermedia]CAA6657026.1 unnamed protein product [Spirodela intermedia]